MSKSERQPAQEVSQDNRTDAQWGLYNSVLAQIMGGNKKVSMTKQEVANGGAQILDEAYRDALQRDSTTLQSVPSIKILKTKSTKAPKFNKQRLVPVIPLAAGALVVGLSVAGITHVINDEPGPSSTRPLPSPNTIGDLQAQTLAACSKYQANSQSSTDTLDTSPMIVDKSVDRYTVADSGVTISFASQAAIKSLFICGDSDTISLNGSYDIVGIMSNRSTVTINGTVGQLYVDNDFNKVYGSEAYIKGTVGDMVLNGSSNMKQDVTISGRVENAIESDDSHRIFWDFDTTGTGEIGRRIEY